MIHNSQVKFPLVVLLWGFCKGKVKNRAVNKIMIATMSKEQLTPQAAERYARSTNMPDNPDVPQGVPLENTEYDIQQESVSQGPMVEGGGGRGGRRPPPRASLFPEEFDYRERDEEEPYSSEEIAIVKARVPEEIRRDMWRIYRKKGLGEELDSGDEARLLSGELPPSQPTPGVGRDIIRKIDEGKMSIEILHNEIRAGQIRRMIDDLVRRDPRGGQDFQEKLERLLQMHDISEVRPRLERIFYDIDKRIRMEKGYGLPDSIQEVASDLMGSEEPEWKIGGENAIIDIIDGKEVFNQENFLKWVRHKMLFFHDQNPDEKLNLFQMVGIYGSLRSVSIIDMISNPGYFFRDKDTDTILTDLRDQVLYEVWLFSKSRNNDVDYRQMKGSDEKLPEALNGIYADNAYTKPETLERVLSMPDTSRKAFGADKNQGTGQALRAAILSYYYMSDIEMLQKLHKNGSAFFDNDAFVEQYVAAKRGGRKSEEELRVDARKMIEYRKPGENGEKGEVRTDLATVFENGKFRNDNKAREQYERHINVFNEAQKDPKIVKEARERIRLSIMKRFGISYSEAEYAETWAYSMSRWTGVAARNDTDAIGFDAWSKLLNFRDYRLRQSSFTRAGLFGNMYNVAGMKRLGGDFFNAVKTVDGKTILESIQGGQGENIRIAEDDLTAEEKRKSTEEQARIWQIGEIRFGENMSRHFIGDHVEKLFKILHQLTETEEYNFDQFVKINAFGMMEFDPQKANKVLDDMFKSIRYPLATWTGVDFSKEVRIWDSVVENGQRKIVYKTVSMAEMMFGPEILERFKGADGEIDAKSIQADNNRREFWKDVVKYLIAAEIKSHRSYRSNYRRYSFGELEQIYAFLERYPGELDLDENDMGNTKVKRTFFRKEDIAWIRKKSNTGMIRTFSQDASVAGAGGTVKGVFDSLKILLKETVR